jgi:hypothetical protein
MRACSALSAVALLLASATAPLLAGCPSNLCLVKVCEAGGVNCRCSWSTCPSGAVYDTNRSMCVCEPGRVPLGGSCLTPAEANEFCGKGNHFERGGCARNLCPPGQEVDQGSGQCLAKQQVDQVAQNMGVKVGQNEKLGCPPGLVLVVEGPQGASCVPPASTCTRDEVWNGQACVKTAQCPPGSVLDAAKNTCVTFASGDSKEEINVDLGLWTHSSYGPDNGDGTSAFCSGFSKKPLSFGVLPGGSIRVLVSVAVQAPGRQVAQAQVATSSVVEATRQPVTAKGAAEVQRAAQEILGALVRQGGKSNTDGAVTHVRCLVTNAAPPTAVPASGGG